MRFFNYLFASSYKAYVGRNSDPRYSSVLLVFGALIGYFGLTAAIIKKIIGDNFKLPLLPHYILYIIAGAIIYILYKYYSEERVNSLIKQFEEKTKLERVLWGWITVLSIIIPYTLMIILLTKKD